MPEGIGRTAMGAPPSYGSIEDVRAALSHQALSRRELQAIWDSRVEVEQPDAPSSEAGDAAGWLRASIELAVQFTRHALRSGALLLACDAAREGSKWHKSADLERDLGVALLRLGSVEEARRVFRHLVDHRDLAGDAKSYHLQLLGDSFYYQALRAGDDENRQEDLRAALDAYGKASHVAPNDFNNVTRAASTALMLSVYDQSGATRSKAAEFARNALSLIGRAPEKDSIGLILEKASALCVSEQLDEATEVWRQAAAHPNATPALLARARSHARELASALRVERSHFDPCFPPLRLVVFSGHMFDAPGARNTRFPQAAEPQARALIAQKLNELQPVMAFSSAAAGADLLFLEQLKELDGGARFTPESHIVLPWARESFIESSVLGFGDTYVARFERALAGADSVHVLGETELPADSAGFEYANAIMGGLAKVAARQQGFDLCPLVFWNGLEGSPGGTGSFVSFWQDQGFEPVHIHSKNALDGPGATEPKTPRATGSPEGETAAAVKIQRQPRFAKPEGQLGREIKTMLFADVVGYSKLPEAVIPAFVRHFMGLVSRLVAESRYEAISLNTWGDAIYFVFDRAETAGLFALELTEQMAKTPWEKFGLSWIDDSTTPPKTMPLSLRTALHTGPVFVHFDPIVRRLGFTGAHVSRAARIEPITRHAEVFASEEYAATTAIESVEDFTCDFVGTLPLAKKYPGTFRIYQLRRVRPFPLEILARAIHEAYRAMEAEKGHTAATNPSMVAWEQLPTDLQLENRAQAAHIKTKLYALGFDLIPSKGAEPDQLELDAKEEEHLARWEHERWCDSKLSRQWKYGPERNDARKLHPSLVPWEKLSEQEKQKDYNAVREIPKLLSLAGFEAVRVRS